MYAQCSTSVCDAESVRRGWTLHHVDFVRRNFSTCPLHIREHCYTTLVRPQLEYASSVWDNNIQCNINKLESVQRRACVMTIDHSLLKLCYRQTSSVTSMLQRLSWDSLQQRRAHNRVWMLYRIRNGLVAIPPDHLKSSRPQLLPDPRST